MKIKITCPCKATFEVNGKFENHPRMACPNCGKCLPTESISALSNLVDDFKMLTTSLSRENQQYSIKISHHPNKQ